jgi:glycosyltransferase involved in cell wall biosynthesis
VKKGVMSSNSMNQPKVAILLCTYNGGEYLADQLESFEAQTYSNWQVFASDDGSKDNTIKILNAFKNKWSDNQLTIINGPGNGVVPNFIALTRYQSINADYFAYSDQDDIWEADKLYRAIGWLETIESDIPALYCSRTTLVDSDNKPIGYSPLFSKTPAFGNAIIQNIAGGNTMMFNNAARYLLCEAEAKLSVAMHDWWVYMVVSGCGGQVFYDPKPSLRYRQHDRNIIGMNSGWAARFRRIFLLLRGNYKIWNNMNLNALKTLSHRLTPNNLKILENFLSLRELSLIPRLIKFLKSGVYRQTFLGNLGLLIAVIIKKV